MLDELKRERIFLLCTAPDFSENFCYILQSKYNSECSYARKLENEREKEEAE